MKKIALTFLICLTFSGCVSNEKDDIQKTKRKIQEALIKWTDSFNEKDLEGSMAIFARDVVGSYQGEPDMNYEQIKKSLKNTFDDKDHNYHYDLEIDEIDASSDLAVSWLFWELEDNGTNYLDERSIDVWHKNKEGKWQITRFNAYPKMKKSHGKGVFQAD